jgi:nucleoside transporter
MASAVTARSPDAPLSLPLRLNLSIMMFLQFAIWGSWFVVFFPYLRGLNFSGAQAGALFGNMALGAILSNLFAGYIADRLLASEKLMAICHLVGALLLYAIAQIQNPQEYWTLFALTLTYALLYNPTLVLANSITFEHVPNGQRDFPGIRVMGTLGWIAVSRGIDLLFAGDGKTATSTNGPLLLAAALSAVLGLYSFFLPPTPPKGEVKGIPFLKALGLFKDFSFAVFFVVSLIITIVLAFYYTVTADFLEKKCLVTYITSTMLIGQVCETVFLPLLPLFLFRYGMKAVLALGMLCWGLRYLCFADAGPEGFGFALAIVGIALHGFCFDFFFAAGFIHCDNKAPRDIRASAQALFSFLTYGVGMWLGSLLCGVLLDHYTNSTTKTVDWSSFWLVPSCGVLGCLVVFLVFFRSGGKSQEVPLSTNPENAIEGV